MRYLPRLYEWLLFAPAVLPLFFIEGMMYPLLAPKTLALRGLGIIVFALFAYLALAGRPFFWSRLRKWTAWIPAALLVLAYFASWVGIDFYHSFWSTFERGDGLLTLTVCVEYFYLLLISAESSWLARLYKVVAWVGTLAAAYLLIQWVAVATGGHFPLVVEPNGRIGGTMGNAAFLAAYLGMAFFATLAAAPEYRGWRRATLYGGACLQVLGVVLTATRGTLLALLAIGTIVLGYLALKGNRRMRAYARIILVAFVVCGGLFSTFRSALTQVPIESVQRLASISFSDPTVASRLFLWKALSREALTRPLLGYGAENINVPFNTVYDPTQIVEEWFDRSHNAFLDYFIQYGIGGLFLYLALIVLLGYAGWRQWIEKNRTGAFLMGVAGVYALQNVFVFDTAMTLWLFLAFLAIALAGQTGSGAQASSIVLRPRPLLGALCGVMLLYPILPVVFAPLRANVLAFEAYQYQIVDVPRANAASERGIALGTYADLEFGYNAYFMYTEEQLKRLSGDDLRAAYENAIMLLTYSFNRYISDARTAVYLAQVLTSTPPGVVIDKNLLTQALERSLRLSSKRAQPWYILANLSISEANTHPASSSERAAGYAAAEDILKRYQALVPNLAEPYFILAQLEYASGDLNTAAGNAAQGKKYYTATGNLETARRAARYYETVLDLPDAAFFLEEIVRLDSSDTAAASDLSYIRSLKKSSP